MQPVLTQACDAGLIDRARYDEFVLDSVDRGDEVVSIDKDVLLAALGEDGEPVPARFKRVVGLLGGPKAEMASHLGVAADFLATIWKDRPFAFATEAQTGEILRNVLKSRWTNWRAVITFARSMLHERQGLSQHVDDYILRWLQGHFLIPWDHTSLPHLQ